jgi:glycolate oxidase
MEIIILGTFYYIISGEPMAENEVKESDATGTEQQAPEAEAAPAEAEEKKEEEFMPTGRSYAKPKGKNVELYNKLVSKLDKSIVTTEDLERVLYSHDTAPIPNLLELGFKMTPDVIVKAGSTDDVVNVVDIAKKHGIPVVPRGTSTWALGGSVPIKGGILLDMNHLGGMVLDEDNFCITVGAGVVWKKVYDYCLQKGYLLGAYPSSALGSTVGGWINTGGIGIGSYKYGGAYDQVRSLEVVLPNGKVINTGSNYTVSNQSGYNLNGLMVGSEGTLGIVTHVTLKLYPAPEEFRPISFSLNSMDELAKAVFHITRENVRPLHIGFADKRHFEALKAVGKDVPNANAIINICLEGTKAGNDRDEELLTEIVSKYEGKKLSGKIAEHEWEERFYEFRAKRLGPSFITSSIFVPVPRFPEVIQEVENLGNAMKVNLAITGVVPDRSTVDYMPYFLTDERKMTFILTTSFTKKLSDIAYKHEGRAAGLGVWMASNLPKFADNSAKTMYDIKSSIDPYDIMNPGKLVEIGTRFGFPVPAMAMDFGMDLFAMMKRFLPHDKLPEVMLKQQKK